MYNEEITTKLTCIKKQFLCCVPFNTFNWQNVFSELNWNEQEILIKSTVDLEVVLPYPIRITYQKAFLKFIINRLLEQETEVHDCIYEALGRLVALPEPARYFKHYTLDNQILTLQENPNIISEGTTGLCSWQAAIALSEWCLAHKSLFENKTVLELGSGVGLTGLVIANTCNSKEIYLTDCHRSVLSVLCDNVRLNSNTDSNKSPETDKEEDIQLLLAHIEATRVKVVKLPWEDITERFCKITSPDILIAADVVYDSGLFPDLIAGLGLFLNNSCELIIACTERNKETLKEFLNLLEPNNLCYSELQLVPQKNFIWSTECPVRIFSVKAARAS